MEERKDLQYFVDKSDFIKMYSENYKCSDIDDLLTWAIRKKHNEVCKEVINLGFDPNNILKATGGCNCLTDSCFNNNKELMRFLIDKIKNLEQQDDGGDTALLL